MLRKRPIIIIDNPTLIDVKNSYGFELFFIGSKCPKEQTKYSIVVSFCLEIQDKNIK